MSCGQGHVGRPGSTGRPEPALFDALLPCVVVATATFSLPIRPADQQDTPMPAQDARMQQAYAQDRRMPIIAYALGMVVLLVLFSFGGDNGAIYAVSLLGVPIMSGILTGLGMIRFWHAALGCLAVVLLDVIFDEARAE